MTEDMFHEGMAAKVLGTKNLHEATAHLPLDLFATISSVAVLCLCDVMRQVNRSTKPAHQAPCPRGTMMPAACFSGMLGAVLRERVVRALKASTTAGEKSPTA
ncbi:hypothetical protein F5Y14DRAFT_403252 [Nemania sp. NC0429]|nr:hypothetical protein F5Y14DRAFT_403252 [Nemania sp. NC0429]